MANSSGPNAAPTAAVGYNRLADFMALRPGVAIFRRFKSLTALNLLSLQAELVDLEDQFRYEWQRSDRSADPDEAMYSRYFKALFRSQGKPGNGHYSTLLRIRAKLDEYNKALLQAVEVGKIPKPTKSAVAFLRGWLWGEFEGQNFLQGIELSTWELKDGASETKKLALEKDLLTLRVAKAEEDALSSFLSGKMLDLYHFALESTLPNHKLHADEYHAAHYSHTALTRINSVIVTVLSSAFPVLGIVALYFINTTLKRLGAVVAFTVIFSFALATCTNARKIEIFASTSAFAAVEVVFIGTVLTGNDTS